MCFNSEKTKKTIWTIWWLYSHTSGNYANWSWWKRESSNEGNRFFNDDLNCSDHSPWQMSLSYSLVTSIRCFCPTGRSLRIVLIRVIIALKKVSQSNVPYISKRRSCPIDLRRCKVFRPRRLVPVAFPRLMLISMFFAVLMQYQIYFYVLFFGSKFMRILGTALFISVN